IVVTADHETGGLSLDLDRLDFAALERVPAGRDALHEALPENGEEITVELALEAAAEALGLADLSDEERAKLVSAAEKGAKDRRNAVRNVAKRIADARAGAVWGTGSHTGVNVPLYAVGVGSERFEGVMDNTRVPQLIRALTLPAVSPAGVP